MASLWMTQAIYKKLAKLASSFLLFFNFDFFRAFYMTTLLKLGVH